MKYVLFKKKYRQTGSTMCSQLFISREKNRIMQTYCFILIICVQKNLLTYFIPIVGFLWLILIFFDICFNFTYGVATLFNQYCTHSVGKHSTKFVSKQTRVFGVYAHFHKFY